MLNINTNLSSLIAQGNLQQSTNQLNQAIERMTTGYKINHASDNAANFSIATKMDTRMGALQVAENNTLQGLEMMYTTSESLSLVGEKLARMRALAVQAQNGTYGTKSLSALSAEADSLLDEINRINQNATYNGIKLFNTGKAEVTNAGKELELNEQGFLQDVVKVDTTGMTPLGSMADDATLAVGEYTIGSKEELIQLQEMATAGFVTAGSTFVLTDNIDLSGVTWKSISCSCSFNGNGYTIKNLTGSNGLFTNTTLVENLKLENVNIESSGYSVGAIAANYTTVRNCVVTGSIISQCKMVGGIEGQAGNVTYCYADVDIIAKNAQHVGGIGGWFNTTSAQYCISTGEISSEGGNVGGICGTGIGYNCASYALISGTTNVGGISGNSNSTLSGCYFGGSVNGNKNVGGITGQYYMFAGNFSNNIVEGSVNGNSDVGIFVGYSEKESSLKNCYYYSKVLGEKELYGENSLYKDLDAIDITVPCDYTFQVGVTGDDATSSVSYTTYIEFGGLKELLVSGIESDESLTKIDELIKVVNMKQTELGAMENRLLSVLDEISVQYDNLVSSYSTIKDADMAEVSSQYIQQQILQQASATLLATANQTPALALQLL